MENRPCLFRRNGRLVKGLIKRVDFKSSKVVISFYEGKCGRTLDLSEIILMEETDDAGESAEERTEKQFSAIAHYKFIILIAVMLTVLTAYSVFSYYKVNI